MAAVGRVVRWVDSAQESGFALIVVSVTHSYPPLERSRKQGEARPPPTAHRVWLSVLLRTEFLLLLSPSMEQSTVMLVCLLHPRNWLWTLLPT